MTDPHSAVMVPIGDIRTGSNYRQYFDPASLEELALSIRSTGLLLPLIVRTQADSEGEPFEGYQLVAGERRLRACQLAEKEEVPCFIRDLTDAEAFAVMLTENNARRDTKPVEDARAFERGIREFGWTVETCARNSGKSVDLVKRRLSLLTLCDKALHLVETGNLQLGLAELMAGLDENRQIVALGFLRDAKRRPTNEEFRAYCGTLRAAQDQEGLFDATNFALQAQAKPKAKKGAKAPNAVQEWVADFSLQTLKDLAAGELPEDYVVAHAPKPELPIGPGHPVYEKALAVAVREAAAAALAGGAA